MRRGRKHRDLGLFSVYSGYETHVTIHVAAIFQLSVSNLLHFARILAEQVYEGGSAVAGFSSYF